MSAPIDHTAFSSAPLALAATPPGERPTTILPHELPLALDWFPEARVLSLDCFDTLLWRDCHAPTDVFWTLPGISPLQRARAEELARRSSIAGKRGHDVPIAEIYAHLMPNATPRERGGAVQAELDAEARHCYGFAPTIALMHAARARGMSIIIVSDTYLDSAQLRTLIARAAGADVAALIDRVFCSSTFGKAKSAGLYGDVLRKLKAKPHEILHIGDNAHADVEGVAPFGVATLHLKQFHAEVEQQFRLEATVSAMLHAHGTGALAAPQPHRPAIAAQSPQLPDGAQHIGYAVLGPVFTGYESWLRTEAAALQAAHGGTVHWVFLMRDGYLPMRVHQADAAARPGHAVEISRYTSTAATFVDDTATRNFLELSIGMMPDIVARQLMIPETDIMRMIDNHTPLQGTLNLLAHMRQDPVRKAVRKAARAMANGIVEHVRRTVNPAPGDTLMLVDLGYNGTVQNNIERLLRDELKVHVAGRYLILRPTEVTGYDKTGYLDLDHYDIVALNAMSANVAVVEQLCTTTIGSVINYTATGEPIRRTNDIKQHQSQVRDAVQQGCLLFAQSHAGHTQRGDAAQDAELWRRANAATLTRLMYLPLDYELRVFEAFEHDVNLGTDETLALFDPAIARRGLRQQGMLYQTGARRMFLPAELAKEGLATRLTHFAANRYSLPLTYADFANDGVMVPVIYADARETVQTNFHAKATHDGYYALCVPMGANKFSAAVQFGAVFEWVEVYSISVLPAAEYLKGLHDTHEREIGLRAILDGITEVAPNLWHCTDPAGFALVQPPEPKDDTKMLMVFVFRPVVTRAAPAIPPSA